MDARRFVTGLGVASLFVWSIRAAMRPGVSERETVVFRWFNDGPDAIEAPVWALTQAGSLGSVLAASGVLRSRGRSKQALTVLGVGSGVWVGIKLIKPLIGRGRPAHHLDRVVVRGRPQRGLGYPSGHAAVSMTLALIATSPGRCRTLAIPVALLIGGGRMYAGAHLPLDVGGGFALGALVGTLTAGMRSDRECS